ncbi:MAG: TIGR02147 family protein, partial [Bdellovibrio sp.]|nr:TIGR02147 family protein [Bdellovibrio sp.]
ELGFDSPVTLRFILKKRRNISKTTVKVLISNLRLNDLEANYFENLVAYSQAKTSAEKQALGASLIKIQRQQFQQFMVPTKMMERNVFAPVILTLLTFDDFARTAKNISTLLGLEEATAEEILSSMAADGLITLLDDQTYHFAESTFKVAGGESLKDFYRYWIDRSKQALELPFEQRRYRALKFALTPEEFSEVIEKLNEYSLLLLSKYQSSALEGRRLYMYETAVFPVSKSLECLNASESTEILPARV